MLVLSRKQNQRVLFPNLGVSVQVLRIAGNAVRVGVEAPSDVRVLREEVADPDELQEARTRRHALRNQLHTANLALHLLQKQLDAGQFEDAEETLERALQEFQELDALAGATEERRGCSAGQEKPKRRALLVEDNAQERELLAGYLRLSGYDVETAEDGLAAMRFLDGHDRPDLVLLDMQMPRMNGVKTVSAIRCNPKYRGLKVFAVSGSDRRTLGADCGDRGVDRWFSKPLKPDQFIGELNRELDGVLV